MEFLKLLLDTHILLWWLSADPKLDPRVGRAIADRTNQILVSVASLWEIAVKVRGRTLDADIYEIEKCIDSDKFVRLPIETHHLRVLTTLPLHHRDPFDHMLIAQAIADSALIVSEDRMIRRYPVELFGSENTY